MIRTVSIAVAVLIAAVLLYAASRPDSFSVQRRAVIAAPPERVFPLINDLRAWQGWSPWEKKDPGMQRSFGDSTVGKGARYAWAGNGEVGRGSMEITDSRAPGQVVMKLDFAEPFEAHNRVEFALRPVADGTEVSWTMSGPQPYLGKLIGLVFDCDTMVGGDFEAGLAAMKVLAER